MRILVVLALVVLAIGCADPPVGTGARPFRMYFVPSVDAEEIASRSGALEEAIEAHVSEKLGEPFHVETGIPQSYVAVVEALGTGKVDLAAFNTFAYVLARDIKGFDIEPLFTILRGADSEETTFRGQILVRADSGIETLEDLEGKSFAYVDPASTSGYVLPSALLSERGIELGDHVFAKSHPNVVSMVYQGRVDAGATYHSPPARVEKGGRTVEEIRDARMRVLSQYPDVAEQVKILALTEEIPNEPWVIRRDLDPDPERSARIRRLVREAIVAYLETEEGKRALWSVATATGLAPATEETYAGIRRMILASGVDVEKAVAE